MELTAFEQIKAPFDGIVTARQVSIGLYVGGSATPTVLATIVQHDPVYVNFNVSEQDVLNVRATLATRGLRVEDLKNVPVEVGLQSETDYPHQGKLDYVSPTVTQSTGTLAVRRHPRRRYRNRERSRTSRMEQRSPALRST